MPSMKLQPEGAHSSMTLAQRIYRSRNEYKGRFANSINEANRLIPEAGRFLVDQSIMNAVQRMEKTQFSDLLQALSYARPPFSPTWIEWNAPGAGDIGYLIEQTGHAPGFAFRQYLHIPQLEQKVELPIICTLGRIFVSQRGYRCEHPAEAASSQNNADSDPYELAASDLISMLLIINSPSPVVTVDEAPNTDRVDERRARKGRPPPNLRRIRLDVARLRRIDVEEGVAQADGQPRTEHFVRGHFKFRNGRMWWWSPHIRNQAGNNKEVKPKEYHVLDSGIN
ncbi:hypothetical protein [Methylorubrum aminovorans]|uniref:hypothetical protein n=1 Tax=Methylorubrum aminovorans TaxID=269069 RepID=UPI0024E04868|nr:hypothetical protein [Methylorubrum aminovorans]